MENCIFCSIVAKTAPADIVYEDDQIMAFRDKYPKAPVHILIIPRLHIPTLNDLSPETAHLVARIILVAKEIAGKEGIAQPGYRVVFNCNRDAGQQVYHIHMHLLGGRLLHWPPG